MILLLKTEMCYISALVKCQLGMKFLMFGHHCCESDMRSQKKVFLNVLSFSYLPFINPQLAMCDAVKYRFAVLLSNVFITYLYKKSQ